MRTFINAFAILAIAISGLAMATSDPVAAAESSSCTTPSGGSCDGAKCCVIDDACFSDCPIDPE